MLSVQTFWSEKRWGLRFGAWGKSYTIVKAPQGGGYHIGFDIASVGDIPCLVAGVVVTAYKTGAMGWCVEVDTGASRIGRGRYFTYCHIAGDRVPKEGERIEVGGRVGRTAMGPRGIPYTSVEFPGTAWYGVHCHLVVSDIRYAAWTIVKGRTLSDFYDPLPIIRQVLSGTAGGGSKPFYPNIPKEDDMAQFTIYKRGGAHLIVGPEMFLEVGGALTITTGVDGARALETFTRLGVQTIDMGAPPYKADDFDILRVHLRAAQG